MKIGLGSTHSFGGKRRKKFWGKRMKRFGRETWKRFGGNGGRDLGEQIMEIILVLNIKLRSFNNFLLKEKIYLQSFCYKC